MVWLDVKEPEKAEDFFNRAMETVESIRGQLDDNDSFKVSLFDQLDNPYRLQQIALVKQNKVLEALEIAERGRARVLAELLASRFPSKTIPQGEDVSPSIAQIKAIAKAQQATLVQYSLITVDRQLYIWVISPSGEITFRPVDFKSLDAIDQLVKTARSSMGVRGLLSVEPKNPDTVLNPDPFLGELHQLLIEPIADLLPHNPEERVVFVPQGSLYLVPFAALRDKEGKYLLEKHTISISPSIQTLQVTRRQQQRIESAALQDVLILGNPTMPTVLGSNSSKVLSSLPGAEQEAKAIANLLGVHPLIGDEAVKSTVVARMPAANIIHLATHGIFNDVRGMESSIALTPSPEDNGYLTAAELYRMKLNAKLVVLSACNTGRGRIRRGEGIVGLSRSFISAGVPSVVVSLWSVPDAPTAELMSQFYRNLEQSGMDKAQALRQAMLATMKTNPNPKDWAAFTLIGEAL